MAVRQLESARTHTCLPLAGVSAYVLPCAMISLVAGGDVRSSGQPWAHRQGYAASAFFALRPRFTSTLYASMSFLRYNLPRLPISMLVILPYRTSVRG